MATAASVGEMGAQVVRHFGLNSLPFPQELEAYPFFPCERHVAVIDDPQNPGQSLLYMGGGPGDDKGSVTQKKGVTSVKFKPGGGKTAKATFTQAIGRIFGLGGEGDATLKINKNIGVGAELHGGPGGDNLAGGSGDDLLFGGPGDDKLNGGVGNDYISGGDGDDRIDGKTKRNVLIGGDGEDRVTGGMPETIVDALEAVEVQEDEGGAGLATSGPRERALEGVAEEGAVREAGQAVVAGQPLEIGLGPQPLEEQADLAPDVGEGRGPLLLPDARREAPGLEHPE